MLASQQKFTIAGGDNMAQANRSESARQRSPKRKPDFMAAVRFKDGERQLFTVSNAQDSQEARQMVLDELQNVRSVVILLP